MNGLLRHKSEDTCVPCECSPKTFIAKDLNNKMGKIVRSKDFSLFLYLVNLVCA